MRGYLTAVEAGEQLDLEPDTVVTYCRRGILSAEKPGRDWLIPEAEVRRYKRERRSPGRPAGT